MQIGIVGLPYSGKTTLFQTITKSFLDTEAGGKSESHQAIVKVPDERLDKLTEIFSPKKTVNAVIEFVDVVGLQKGDQGSTQFTTNFLAKVKTNDALLQVVRLFDDEAVAHPDGSIDMLRDITSFETEFILSDMAIVENRLEKIKKQILKTSDDLLKRELPVLEKCYDALQNEKALRDIQLNKDEMKILKTYQLLSVKPMLIALNLDENQISRKEEIINKAKEAVKGQNTKILAFFGKVEKEMAELPDEDAQVFMAEYGIKESALNTIIKESYDLLGLQSFLTAGEDECRAWTIRKGENAQEAAGEIHTDFYNKFIRAEVVGYEDFLSAGTFAKAKEKGTWRLEGKEYVVKDGDIISIRHS
jgi:GTP-binding protein YchF